MTTTATRKRYTTRDAFRAIADLQPFITSGALSGHDGEDWRGPWNTGRLESGDQVKVAIREGRAAYVVTLYATPVAVVDGVWLITSQRFSLSTSRHQQQARNGASISGLPTA